MTLLFAVYQTSSRANGGVESVTSILEALAPFHQLIVVTQRETSFTRRWRKAGAEVIVWETPTGGGVASSWKGIRGNLQRLIQMAVRNWRIRALIRRHRVDLLHCNDTGPVWDCLFAAKASRIPLVINLRDTKAAGEKISRLKYRIWNRFCAGWILLSREMAEFYRKILDLDPGQVGRRLRWTYSIVDPSRFHPLDAEKRRARREELGIGKNEFAVGFVAAFSPKKNQLEFIEKAIPGLKTHVPDAKVWFLGDFDPAQNPYARQCETAAASASVTDLCRFQGFVGDVSRWYPALDAVVVPTRKEGLARCMIESVACGTPVVSFDVCSAHEILTEREVGKVVPQGDYARIIKMLAELAGDDESRERMGLRGEKVADELFRPNKVVERHEEIYLSLVAR